MATPPQSTKDSLGQRLRDHARTRWPALTDIEVRFRCAFAYVTGHLADGTALPLFRLRYTGYANMWGFAIYLASKDGYEDAILPNGSPAGSAEEALDCACGLYLNDPTARRPAARIGPDELPARTLSAKDRDPLILDRLTTASGWGQSDRLATRA